MSTIYLLKRGCLKFAILSIIALCVLIGLAIVSMPHGSDHRSGHKWSVTERFNDDDDDDTNDDTTNDRIMRLFDRRLSEGADCNELYSIRESLSPQSSAVKSINIKLRSIGCYSRSSTRER